MRRVRVIPTLLFDSNGRLVKTVRFGKRTYIGDPINAVKILNEKEVDELVLLDIDASKSSIGPRFDLIEDIVSEAFMPVAYGGGIRSIRQAEDLFQCGLEKLILNSSLFQSTALVGEIADRYGSQSIVASLDVRKNWLGSYRLTALSGTVTHSLRPSEWAKQLVDAGVGEIIVQSVDHDGTYLGYDIELLKLISDTVDVPVVASGGARGIGDFVEAIQRGGCSAVAAGSIFVYQSKTRGILISYPSQTELHEQLFKLL